MNNQQIKSLISKSFRELDSSEKEKYLNQAHAAHLKYKEEMAEYKKTERFAVFQKKLHKWKEGRIQMKKDPNRPKKPRSAYQMFCSEELGKRLHSNDPIHDFLNDDEDASHKKVDWGHHGSPKALWQSLSAEEKAKYEQKHDKLKDEYITKMIEYQKTAEYASFQRKSMGIIKSKSASSSNTRGYKYRKTLNK